MDIDKALKIIKVYNWVRYTIIALALLWVFVKFVKI